MGVTEFTIIMAIAWCCVFMAVSSLLIRNNKFILRFGITTLIVLLLSCLLRLLLSVELPFTTVIRSEHIFPQIIELGQTPRFSIGDSSYSVFDMLLLVWFTGAVLFVVGSLLTYAREIYYLNLLRLPANATTNLVFERLATNNTIRRIEVIISAHASTPCAGGLLRPRIYLPPDTYDETSLTYILKHEIGHIVTHDAMVKILLMIIVALFWWLPILWIFQRDFHQVLELKADSFAMEGQSKSDRRRHLECLIEVSKNAQKNWSPLLVSGFLGRQGNEARYVKQRFEVVYKSAGNHRTIRQRIIGSICFAVVISVVLLSSFAFVVQPYFPAPVSEGVDRFQTSLESLYAIRLPDGRIGVFVNGELDIIYDALEDCLSVFPNIEFVDEK